MKLLHVVGARPNFPKVAPVYRAARALGLEQLIVHTGQHYDERLSASFFRDLDIPEPHVNLAVGSASHAVQTARIMERFEPVVCSERPDWVVVYGVGAVGYGLVQIARLRGARVIAVGRTPEKLERARGLGADATVRAGVEDVAARVRELTGGRGADVVFELVATRETMAASSRALAKRGRLVFVGYSEATFEIHPIQLVVGEQVVTASVGNTLAELQAAVELVAAGRVETVVDRVLPLERFQEGIDALAAGRLVGRAVLAP